MASDAPKLHAVQAPLQPAIALAYEAAGTAKAHRDWPTLLILGLPAGAFVAFGANFMTLVLTGATSLPFGVARLLAGLVFSRFSPGGAPA